MFGDAKARSILDMKGLSEFVVELAHIWAERGFRGGVKLGPFDQFRKDPYCEVYKELFSTMEKLAARRRRSGRTARCRFCASLSHDCAPC
jgi:hypothetical protein